MHSPSLAHLTPERRRRLAVANTTSKLASPSAIASAPLTPEQTPPTTTSSTVSTATPTPKSPLDIALAPPIPEQRHPATTSHILDTATLRLTNPLTDTASSSILAQLIPEQKGRPAITASLVNITPAALAHLTLKELFEMAFEILARMQVHQDYISKITGARRNSLDVFLETTQTPMPQQQQQLESAPTPPLLIEEVSSQSEGGENPAAERMEEDLLLDEEVIREVDLDTFSCNVFVGLDFEA